MKTILGTFLVLTLLVAFSRSQKPVKCSNSLQCYLHYPPPPGFCCCSTDHTCKTVFNCLKMKGSCLILPSSKDRSCKSNSLTLANYTWTFDSKQGDQSVEGITKKECAEKCLSNSWCSGWTWSKDDSSGSICHLFKTLKNQHKCDPCAECLSGKITHVSGVCSEKWIAAETTKTELDCLELCSMNSKCQYYSYATGNLFSKTCFLFSQCTPVKTCEKFESGKLDCIEPPKTTVLPKECGDYLSMDDGSRNIKKPGFQWYCDDDNDKKRSPDWQGGNHWYRMLPPAGVVIPETKLPEDHCGTRAVGWIRGSHPKQVGASKNVTVCFTWSGRDCWRSNNIQITKCDNFFVYLLPEVPQCHARYCAADTFKIK